nr:MULTISPECIES: DUF11 domain-containing protein [Kitasatospora]
MPTARAPYPTVCAELSLTERPDPSSGHLVGDEICWTLTPHNAGPRSAPAGWSITQLLPPEVELVSLSGPGHTVSGLTATATATTELPAGTDGPALTATVRARSPQDLHNVAYVAPLPPSAATDLDGDGYPDTVFEHLNPLVVPTPDTDTDTSPTDNDAQGHWTVTAPTPAPAPTPTPTPAPVPTPALSASGGDGRLPDTGTELGTQAALSAFLLSAGALAHGLGRRRKR